MELTIKCKCGSERKVTFDELNNCGDTFNDNQDIAIYPDYDSIHVHCNVCGDDDSVSA